MTAPLLEVGGLRAGYGSMTVVNGVDLTVATGEIVAVVGRNGAGKTTTMSAIAGLRYGSAGGTVRLDGEDITNLSAAKIVERGLAFVPEGHRVFRHMTVLENLLLGGFTRRREGRALQEEALERVYGLFPILEEFRGRPAGLCSGGQQQMVAIGQALMARPRLLILDEPTSGLAAVVIKNIWGILRQLQEDGLSILVVEQSVQRALDSSDRCYVIEAGQVALSGPSAELARDDRVKSIVTGTAVAA